MSRGRRILILVTEIRYALQSETNWCITLNRFNLRKESYLWYVFENELSKVYWKQHHIFWSKGYFVCSIGEGASYKTIQEYIKSQG